MSRLFCILETLSLEHAIAPERSSAIAAGPLRTSLALILVFTSGACGLVWQMLWTAGFGVALGHEVIAVLAVLGAFFGGLAAGSFLLSGPIERSTRPSLWYALLEVLIAGWGLGVTLLLPSIAAPVARWMGPEPSAAVHGALAFGLPLALLLPATFAMGGTLPALERQLRTARRSLLPLLYAGNTAGAVAGVLLAVFVAIPEHGLQATAWICAALNLTCAALALLVWRGQTPALRDGHAARADHLAPRRTMLRLFATGLLGIGYEVLAVRVLSQVCENTVYTYALLLAVFLLGTAGGAALLRRRRAAPRSRDALADTLLLALALAVLGSGIALWWVDRVQAWPAAFMGPGLASGLAGEALAGAVVMLVPSVVMGALFSLLCVRGAEAGMGIGRATGLNTLGCALAPALVGAVLAPWFGAKAVLVLLVLGYLALVSARAWRSPLPAVIAAAALAVAGLAPALRFVDVPPGGRILSHREGAMAAVSVVTDSAEVARLHINNRVQEGSSAGGLVEMRLAQLPLLLHPAPHKTLFLGLGTGYTANAAAIDPQVQVTAVELLPEVIDASSAFMLRPGAPRAAGPVAIVNADARRFVLAGSDRYDVVVADLFHPARSGAASLYTTEHFQAVRDRLAPGGLFCQWLALHQMDLATLRSIVTAFLQVYPDAVAVLAGNGLDTPVLGLVARPDAPRWRFDSVAARLAAPAPAMASALATARIDSAYAVLGAVLADAHGLRRFAGAAPANTDDRPLVAQRAALVDYGPEESPRERLATLLQTFAGAPDGALERGDPQTPRIAAYWRARAQYVGLGMALRPDPDPRVMLDRLGPGLLQVLRTSPEFQPAAEALAALAQAIAADDYPLSQRVLAALRIAQGGPAAQPAESTATSSRIP